VGSAGQCAEEQDAKQEQVPAHLTDVVAARLHEHGLPEVIRGLHGRGR